MRKFKLTVLAIIIVFVIIVILQNISSVEFQFLLYSVTMSKALLLFLTAFIGFIIGILFSYIFIKKRNTR
ncbi:MAG: LapA family protein [Victivallales bacterium]|nr:LapA family protein [Victivallales bacterium]MCF7888820.1 LapA family protein [Victivallales bacterium]